MASWVARTPDLEVPRCYRPPLAPWVPAGLKPLAPGHCFLNSPAPSRPSRPSTPSRRPSTPDKPCRPDRPSTASRPSRPATPVTPSRPRPVTATPRPTTPTPMTLVRSRPNSAPAPRTAQRPCSAEPARPSSARAKGPRPASAPLRAKGQREEMPSHHTSVGSAERSIYTDHGSSDSEHEASYVQYAGCRSRVEREADQEPKREQTAEEDTPTEAPSDAESEISTWSTTRVEKLTGEVILRLLRLSCPERRVEMQLGELLRTVEGSHPVTFDVEDLRAPETLRLSVWTCDGECVASGQREIELQEQEVRVPILENDGRRGLAVVRMEVQPRKPQLVVYGHGDALCSRSMSLYHREELVQDCQVDVDARCWSYLEHRFENLKLKRRQRLARVQAARALHVLAEVEGPMPRLRVTCERARRLQRFLRPLVRGTHGRKFLASMGGQDVEAEALEQFLREGLRAPLSPVDALDLRALLVREGRVSVRDLLRFVDSGLEAVPGPRVVYPDEERARDIMRELFPNFVAEEQQREQRMDLEYGA